jgi:hypothetical protein
VNFGNRLVLFSSRILWEFFCRVSSGIMLRSVWFRQNSISTTNFPSEPGFTGIIKSFFESKICIFGSVNPKFPSSNSAPLTSHFTLFILLTSTPCEFMLLTVTPSCPLPIFSKKILPPFQHHLPRQTIPQQFIILPTPDLKLQNLLTHPSNLFHQLQKYINIKKKKIFTFPLL